MAAAMKRFVEVVKQYPVQHQVDLAVEIEVPGSWFGAGPMGSLTVTEQREKYKAQAVEYAEVHEFPGASKGARKTREKAIRFICITDATEEPNSEGYWMKLSQWNRYRNDTFKDRREDELADTDNSLDIIKLEEAKYASICVSVLANPQPYMNRHLRPLSLLVGSEECPSCALLSLGGGGGVREGGERQRLRQCSAAQDVLA